MIKEGARLACQAALRNDAAKELAARAIIGTATMRRGTANLYALYLSSADYSQTCQNMLLQLAADEDDEVRQGVARCFAHVKPEEHFEQLRSFVDNILPLPAIEASPRELLEFIKPISDMEHDLALRVTRRIIEALKASPERSFLLHDEDVVSLPLTVYNRSSDPTIKEQAMALFEELLALGSQGAKTALTNWDEHRAFAIQVPVSK